ncbi:ribosome maturation factor RimP [uncultured Clostridium sp.]|uniref:ribosome maturation factor RimP n=1 Tax=uncultured Clostridium sp. TaxID=59620 RepID=UPI00260F63E6|nr:ribosome maturation factor RimP [uncultured Clostridium sp.]
MKKDALMEKIEELILPITDELGYELYHVEFVHEDGENYLRVYIDSEEGIKLTDCEAVSRKVSDMLDSEDPIDKSYYLEVSSPGIDKGLYKEEHFLKAIGAKVFVKFTGTIEGKKHITGILKEVNNDIIIIEGDVTLDIPTEKIKSANIQGEL